MHPLYVVAIVVAVVIFVGSAYMVLDLRRMFDEIDRWKDGE